MRTKGFGPIYRLVIVHTYIIGLLIEIRLFIKIVYILNGGFKISEYEKFLDFLAE